MPGRDEMDASRIQKGMAVWDSRGETVGTVEAVYPYTGPDRPNPLPAVDAGSTEPGGKGLGAGGAGGIAGRDFFVLEESGPHLGPIGRRQLYIPFDAVREVTYSEITLNCTKADAQDWYSVKPDLLVKGE
jgi:hypothetical protein